MFSLCLGRRRATQADVPSGADVAVSWTLNGKRVLFRSSREAYADFARLYTVPVEGGWPEVLPMWRGEEGLYSADASRLAYVL